PVSRTVATDQTPNPSSPPPTRCHRTPQLLPQEPRVDGEAPSRRSTRRTQGNEPSLLSLPILARPLRFDPHWAGAQLIPPRSSATRAAAMESPGGGADARARSRQYDYGANSNLVVNTGSRPRDAHHEPTGEPQTLSGRIRARSFGDRAVRTRPPGLEEKRGESRGKKARDAASADLPHRDAKRVRRGSVRPEDNVLSLAHDALYKPRTRETRTAYEALLSVIQRQLGGQPLDVLGDAADEVLAALKDDRIRNPDKKKVIEKLINPVSGQMFHQLVSIGKLITISMILPVCLLVMAQTCHSMMILALLLSSKRMRMIRSITFIR
uniref:Pre-mRNA-splicing helicase BRR2-like plug domain-containing protein n=1 Tax=Aegilops tauschii subsp. strangulata TaxID=200361 RepID=A0A453R8G3_AEGTS